MKLPMPPIISDYRFKFFLIPKLLLGNVPVSEDSASFLNLAPSPAGDMQEAT